MACKRSAVRSRLPPPTDTVVEEASQSLSSRGLGHRPFTAVTRVRIPSGTPAHHRHVDRDRNRIVAAIFAGVLVGLVVALLVSM